MTSGENSMGNKQRLQNEIKGLFLAKRKRRLALAKLPIERKILILTDLQKLAGEIRETVGGIKRRPWKIPGTGRHS